MNKFTNAKNKRNFKNSNRFNNRNRNNNNNPPPNFRNPRNKYNNFANNWFSNWNTSLPRFQSNRLSKDMNYIPNFVLRNLNTTNKLLKRNKKINKINNKINKVERDINNIVATNNTLSNVFKSKREMRNDKLINAMNMSRFRVKLAFYRTPKPIIKYAYYNKAILNLAVNAYNNYLYWFPYTYPHYEDNIIEGHHTNRVTNLIDVMFSDQNTATLALYPMSATALVGECRLIAATLKLTNISPTLSRNGSYTIYKTTNPGVGPFYYPSTNQVVVEHSNIIIAPFREDCQISKNQVTQKQLFTANDTAVCDEYNVVQGNNIFGNCNEYLGLLMNEQHGYTVGPPGFARNPTGTNIKYIIEFSTPTELQTYVIETYSIWEVAPAPQTDLDGITESGNLIFNSAVREAAAKVFPIHKLN